MARHRQATRSPEEKFFNAERKLFAAADFQL
jgi:hypothetical protein